MNQLLRLGRRAAGSRGIRILAVLLIAAMGIFLLNHYTPMYADDYNYSYNFATGERLASFSEIPRSMKSHYEFMNGRTVVHGLAQAFLLLGQGRFDVLNTLGFLLLAVLICLHGAGSLRQVRSSTLAFTLLGLWFCTPAFGQSYLWTVGAANYLYGILIILLFLLPYRLRFRKCPARKAPVWRELLLLLPGFAGGFLAGATNENTGVALVVILLGFCVGTALPDEAGKRGSFRGWMWAGLAGSVCGVASMLLSPGQQRRLSNMNGLGSFGEMMRRLGTVTVDMMRYLLPLWLALVLMLTVYFSGRNTKWSRALRGELLLPLIFFLGAGASVYSMVASPAFPERAWSGPVVLCLVVLCSLDRLLPRTEKMWRQMTAAALCVLGIAFAGSYVTAFQDVKKVCEDFTYRQWYLRDQAEQGNLNVETYALSASTPYSCYYRGMDLYPDPDQWPNTAIARYYGLESVCKRTD